MFNRATAVALRWVAAAFLFASALAHAFGGWPPLAAELAARGVDAGVAGALQIGWYWGSCGFLAMAWIAVAAARARPEEERLAARVLRGSGLVLVAFGIGAMVARAGNPHFLLFVFLGLLLLGGASARR